MTNEELDVIYNTALLMKSIADRTTSGNVSHNIANIKSGCIFILDTIDEYRQRSNNKTE